MKGFEELREEKEERREYLQGKIKELEEDVKSLRMEVEYDRKELADLEEESLDMRIRVIVAQEAAQRAWESLLRSMGYVKSFYGHEDLNLEDRIKEAEDKLKRQEEILEDMLSKESEQNLD